MIEDKIQEAIKPIISIYNQIELEIIEKIAQHFNLNDEFINSDYWYFEKLKEMGGLNNQTIKLLQKKTNKTKQELLKAMQNIGQQSIPTEQLNIAVEKGKLLNPKTIINSQTIQNIINYSYNETEKEFMRLNKTIEQSARETYKDIMTQTYIKTSNGFCSYQEAILESLDELGNKGITLLEYQTEKGKKSYDIVGTVRRDLLCATRGLAARVNEETIKESGNHIVRVSNHFGARTGDAKKNFTNHAWWQELQFFCWNYDNKATEEEKKLPDFMEHCNYGHVQGIVGINCKHFFTVWYGSLEKDKLDFSYEENQEKYEKMQQQRYLERGTRKWKRKQVIANRAQDEKGYKKASQKTKEWQDKLKAFTEQNNLRRDYTREHIKDYKVSTKLNNNDTISKNKNKEEKELQYIDITNEMYNNAKPNRGKVEKQKYFEDNGKTYIVDGRNVVYKHDTREIEVAKLLNKSFGGNVKILPNINFPQGIKSLDYLYRGERTDLKRITSKRANDCVKTVLRNKEKQANNFIIDNTAQNVSDEDILKQIDEIYSSKGFLWIDKIYLLKDDKFIKIFKRK